MPVLSLISRNSPKQLSMVSPELKVELDLVRGGLGVDDLDKDRSGLHLDHHGGHFVFWG